MTRLLTNFAFGIHPDVNPRHRPVVGQVVSTAVQPDVFGPGRRKVTERFFGDHTQAVRDAERFL
jgi:hypothetical protein